MTFIFGYLITIPPLYELREMIVFDYPKSVEMGRNMSLLSLRDEFRCSSQLTVSLILTSSLF